MFESSYLLQLLVAALAICGPDNTRVEARRSVQKYEQDEPTFLAYGLRTIGRPLGRRQSQLEPGRQVGLRAAIMDYLEDRLEAEPDNFMTPNSTISSEGVALLTKPNKRSAEATRMNYLISPISNQILLDDERELANSVADSLGQKYQTARWRTNQPPGERPDVNSLECRTVRASVSLTKDDVDKVSGQLVRNCRGAVALNRCEGSCSSSVLPSIRARNGFKKECRCCNESSFRRVQVRLRECYSTLNNGRIVATMGQQFAAAADEPNSYMDIEVEEPIDCRCRSCDSYL